MFRMRDDILTTIWNLLLSEVVGMQAYKCNIDAMIKYFSKYFQKVQEIQEPIEFRLNGSNQRKSQILSHRATYIQ